MAFPYLQKTSLWNALSHLGKSIITPKGIFYWSNRARTEAQIDGTIGVAQDDDGTISHLFIAEKWAGTSVVGRYPKGKVFGYAPIEGVLQLREKWLKKMLERWPELARHATLPVVTNGITHGLALASRLLLEPGQTLITADKSWENYEHIFTHVQGIKITQFPIFDAQDNFNINGLINVCKSVAAEQKKVIILLNFPHNQTGFMPDQAVCEHLTSAIHQLCRTHQNIPFVIILDDAYEGYVYDENGQKSSLVGQMSTVLPNLNVAKLDGISKVMLAYGYRVAFLTFFLNSLDGVQFSDEFLKGVRSEMGTKIGGLVRGEISQVNHHGQLLADALMDEWHVVNQQRERVILRLKERWWEMMTALEDNYKKYGKKKMWADPCNGGFFGYINLAEDIDPKDVAQRLLKEKKVGVVPGNSGLRMAFAGVPMDKISTMIRAIFETVYE